jgi:hypothetical protein
MNTFILKNITYMYQMYNNGLLKLKIKDWLSTYAFLNMHFCACFLFGIFYEYSNMIY